MSGRRPFRSNSLPLSLQALDRRDLPSAALPFADGFEAASLGAHWGFSGTNNGAVALTTGFSPISGVRQVLVGPSGSGINSRSELILHADLGGVKNAIFTFKAKEFNDTDHPMPVNFVGTSNTDGVALSVDGTNWHRLVSLTGTASQNVAQIYTYNLGQFAANNGLELTGDTMIKFQNYSNQAAPNGGFAFDDVNITISGLINGKVYEDANADGVYQAGETLSPGHKIYLDTNSDGRLNVGTQTAVFTEQLPAPIFDTKRSLYPMFVYGYDNETVGDVDVNLALAHSYTADLDISLIAPDGRRVLLTSDNGGNGDHYYLTNFDDDASTSITAGSAPFTGSFRPEGKLSDMNGAPLNGWWFLEIIDDQGGDSGTLGGWSLDLGRIYTKVVNQPISESQVNYYYLDIGEPSYDDLDVVVNIQHPNVGDLSMLLATPNNDWVYLAENYGGTGNNFTNTRFDDEASIPISSGSAPFTGSFQPKQPLSSFEDLGIVFSKYELRVSDDFAGNVGTMKDFSVILTETWTAGAEPVIASNPNYADRYASFQVPDLPGTIVDLDLMVHINHSNNEVLNLELSHTPTGQTIDVTSGNALQGASGDDFINTTFDDEATIQLIGATGPYSGSYRPHHLLSAFDGINGEGNWKLKVDNTKLAGGQLNWAALLFTTAQTATNYTVTSINDQSTLNSNLNVSGVTGSLADLDVRININHSYAGDLDVYLTAPNGKKVELFTDVGGGSDNFTGTRLDDEAGTAIVSGAGPFSGTFRPEGSLSDFDGIDPNGTWVLTVTDDANGDAGLLLSWSLDMTTGERFDITDANGEYSFDNLAPGNVTIRADQNAGIDWTNPNSGTYTETLNYGVNVSGRDFGFVEDTKAPNAAFVELIYAVLDAPLNSIDIQFSEPVTGVDISDFRLKQVNTTIDMSNATISTVDNVTWTISNLAGLNAVDGNYSISLVSVGSGIMDSAMNPMASFTNPVEYWKVDQISPQIISLTMADPAVTNMAQVRWQFEFSEAVYGLSPQNFELTGTAAYEAEIVSVSGNYVYVNVFNNGTLGLKMVNSTGTADPAGNLVSNLPFQGETYTVNRPSTQVLSVQVNDGAVQRSKVGSLTVNFNQPPTFAGAPVESFQLKRTDGAIVDLNANWVDNQVTLTFAGPLTQFGSLVDGRYDLTIMGSKVANLVGNAGADYKFNLHRLFGDSDGDANITSADFAEFRKVMGTGGISYFDFDGDLGVNSNDFAEFRKRFGLGV